MFIIRRIYDNIIPRNREAVSQAQQILRQQFSGLSSEDIEKLPGYLRNPLKHKFHSILFAAEDGKGQLKGFALLFHASDLHFCYLDFISAAEKKTGGGIGGALYERIRETARKLGVVGLFFECLPDDPALCSDPSILKQNAARLRFYERFGARPIANTAYETPVKPEYDCPPYLVFDDLDQDQPLSAKQARIIVKAVLERKYGDICPPDYIKMVVRSFQEDPIQLRPYKYIKHPVQKAPQIPIREELKIALIKNDNHTIHHIQERGYVESPVRIKSILTEIDSTALFDPIQPSTYPDKHILAVHNPGFVRYLKKVCTNVPVQKSIYPYVFPIRNAARPPKDLPIRAGYYCIDTFTPLNQNAYLAARGAVDCALTAADCLLEGYLAAYALVRPPGHHAENSVFGGFCYFNSTAIATQYLSQCGKVAILDIDYHHGNGQQNIFYHRSDVLTLSIHGHPSFAYPYFSGFKDEIGEGEGIGFNINYPLQEVLDGKAYRMVFGKALRKIRRFNPQFVVVAFGLDVAKGDPTGTWSLTANDFEQNGLMIGRMGYPILVVQEGGYRVRSMGVNARHFFIGLSKGMEETFNNQ